jgi:hypothetical protein
MNAGLFYDSASMGRPRQLRGATAASILGLAAVVAPSLAPSLAPILGGGIADARPASTGFFAEGGLGATGLLGSAKNDAKVGPTIDIRIGRDLWSWLSVGVDLNATTHEATVPPPPVDQYFQLYRGALDVRLGGRFDRLALFVEGGAGVGMISSNILGKVMITDPGERFSLALHGGAGFEYQLENRHYAVGMAGTYVTMPQFASLASAGGRVFLRYTY